MRRAIVVGGSLGGLFAGCNLHRAGWDVTIVERTAGRLQGRGAGLGVHPPMLQGLLAAGARVDTTIGVPVAGRVVFERDGSVMSEIDMPQFVTSWARLYSLLSDAFPEARVRRGVALTGFDQDGSGVTARLSDGTSLRADLLVGADGLRSTVRRQLLPEVEFSFCGYVGWRGLAEESAFSPATHAAMFHRFAFAIPEGEHILGYPVPGENDDLTPGRRRYNWVWYRPVAADRLRDMQTDADGRLHADGIPPQAIRPDVLAALYRDADASLCAGWAEIVRITELPLFQPIGDLESPRIAFGRVALLGDAAFVARPHVARGAIKAGHDAIALAAALAAEPSVEAGLQRYDAERRPAGAALVEESRQLGAYLEGKLGRIQRDPVAVMCDNGGVDSSMMNDDGGLFLRLLREVGYA